MAKHLHVKGISQLATFDGQRAVLINIPILVGSINHQKITFKKNITIKSKNISKKNTLKSKKTSLFLPFSSLFSPTKLPKIGGTSATGRSRLPLPGIRGVVEGLPALRRPGLLGRGDAARMG